MIDDISQSIHKVKVSLYEHQICITECVIQLWNYVFMIVHIRLSLVLEVVLGTCNTPSTPGPGGVTPGSLIGYLDWPHRPTLVFSAHFVLTRAHLVTHIPVGHPY